jgi:drug/metabolite transporter (DMT)-like permease
MVDVLQNIDVLQQLQHFDMSSIGHTAQHAFDMNSWTVDSFLKNFGSSLKRWAGSAMIVFGVLIMFLVMYFAFKVVSDKQQRGKWLFDLFVALIFAGLLLYGGYSLFSSVSSGVSRSVKQMGR